MNGSRFLLGMAFLAALTLTGLYFFFQLNFTLIPLAALGAGLILYLVHPQKALMWFLFALPWTSALPALDANGYPFNYMATPLFLLSGMILVSMWRRETLDMRHPLAFMAVLMALIALVSAIFLALRWSNITLAGLAFLRDTPVSPDGQRVSFAVVFPLVSMMLAAVTPHLFMMLRLHEPPRSRALNCLFAGYGVTLAIALIQRFIAPGFLSRGYFVFHNQLNGGTSDFNSLGFMSGFVFLAALLRLMQNEASSAARSIPARIAGILLLPGALFGLILSGSRSGFLFVIAAAVVLLTGGKWSRKTRALLLLGSIVILMLAGGVLRQRVTRTVTELVGNLRRDGWFTAVDRASNQRLTMWRSGIRLMREAPLTGVGTGNFIFALKNLHYGENHLEDLPLNQYLLVASETGFAGAIVFLGLLWAMARKPRQRAWLPLFWTVLAVFLVGTPLWLPELALLFWLLAWLLDPAPSPMEKPAKRQLPLLCGLLLLFCLGSAREFSRLHPLNWCLARNVPYNYGIWPADLSAEGQRFVWTRAAAGRYLAAGTRTDLRLVADAPFAHLPGGKQHVRVFWRGKEIRNLQAHATREWPLKLHSSRGGFLEFRVDPAFNLKRLGLGREGRTLGVQIHGLVE